MRFHHLSWKSVLSIELPMGDVEDITVYFVKSAEGYETGQPQNILDKCKRP